MAVSPTYLKILHEAPQALPEPAIRERGQRLTVSALMHSDTIAIEFVLSCISILSGLWLVLPFDVFISPFPLLSEIFSEPACGLWMAFVGGLRLGVLWSGKVKYRQIMAFLAFLTWLNLLSWVIVSEPTRMISVFFGTFALISFWVFLRGPSRISHRVASRAVAASCSQRTQ